ncbi:host cell division inhibitor Icd-like protein [Yersinia wautersii]|nr:host cell division inhibitor Icd-like protein [Yersinia pseudotuberculosis]
MVRCSTVCTKEYESKRLTCSTLKNRLVFNTLILSACENSEARKCVTTSRASIHNVNEAYTMEYSHSTPTRFKFLFLAVCRSDLNAKPHRESATAHSEQDARRSLAGQFVLSFAGRLPEVIHA